MKKTIGALATFLTCDGDFSATLIDLRCFPILFFWFLRCGSRMIPRSISQPVLVGPYLPSIMNANCIAV
jgi:hypothetical protein